ncbi:hypothetical protein FGADI_3308 [Fusarium gaditjirri]|uniref:Uncharacterized protein n=1 Tax=Fusarium gaditjirri TaxID=282569 RepID=A0A8H4X044_9HYPO|nr:hypothetical protein FGADI_3308 [Fusarium gaditjirri]
MPAGIPGLPGLVVPQVRDEPRVSAVPLVGVNRQAKSKFIETLFDRAEGLEGTTFEADAMNIDLGSRTKSYFSYHFGNLPFSCGIKASHYPAIAQQSQLQNYYAKHNWTMMTATDGHGVDSVIKAWVDTLKKARHLVTEGAKPADLTERFPTSMTGFDQLNSKSSSLISTC